MINVTGLAITAVCHSTVLLLWKLFLELKETKFIPGVGKVTNKIVCTIRLKLVDGTIICRTY